MMSYDRLIELAFGISFLVNFFIGMLLFDSLSGTRKRDRDLNSPKYLASLLLGFLGGILAETGLTSLLELGDQGQLSWVWPGLLLEVAIGTTIIFVLLYFLLLGARTKDTATA